VIARVAVPKKLSRDQKLILEQLAETMPAQAEAGSEEEKPFFERVKDIFT
jgi:DnaJ-class molecular chaperone